MTGRAESCGHVRKVKDEGAAPTIGVDYVHMNSEQEKEEEKGMPIVVIMDSRTKMTMARVAPGKGLENHEANRFRFKNTYFRFALNSGWFDTR